MTDIRVPGLTGTPTTYPSSYLGYPPSEQDLRDAGIYNLTDTRPLMIASCYHDPTLTPALGTLNCQGVAQSVKGNTITPVSYSITVDDFPDTFKQSGYGTTDFPDWHAPGDPSQHTLPPGLPVTIVFPGTDPTWIPGPTTDGIWVSKKESAGKLSAPNVPDTNAAGWFAGGKISFASGYMASGDLLEVFNGQSYFYGSPCRAFRNRTATDFTGIASDHPGNNAVNALGTYTYSGSNSATLTVWPEPPFPPKVGDTIYFYRTPFYARGAFDQPQSRVITAYSGGVATFGEYLPPTGDDRLFIPGNNAPLFPGPSTPSVPWSEAPMQWSGWFIDYEYPKIQLVDRMLFGGNLAGRLINGTSNYLLFANMPTYYETGMYSGMTFNLLDEDGNITQSRTIAASGPKDIYDKLGFLFTNYWDPVPATNTRFEVIWSGPVSKAYYLAIRDFYNTGGFLVDANVPYLMGSPRFTLHVQCISRTIKQVSVATDTGGTTGENHDLPVSLTKETHQITVGLTYSVYSGGWHQYEASCYWGAEYPSSVWIEANGLDGLTLPLVWQPYAPGAWEHDMPKSHAPCPDWTGTTVTVRRVNVPYR